MHQSRRAGLAPLEFVLALPILLFLMALMINFGIIGAWKVRTQTNTRYAAWRSVDSRSGQFNPTPPYWPSDAPLSEGTGDILQDVQALWDGVPELTYEFIRGPTLGVPMHPVVLDVRPPDEHDGFEMDRGVHQGRGQLDRPLPMLPGATASGRFAFDHTVELLDNRWQFRSLGVPWNDDERARRWYRMEHSDLAALDLSISLAYEAFLEAFQLLLDNPNPSFLYPLDRDEEFLDTVRRCTIVHGDDIPLAPDFYPRLGNGCTLDPQVVQDDLVAPLIDRILNLPCTMGNRFIQLYDTEACCWEGDCRFGDAAYWNERYTFVMAFLSKAGCDTRDPREACRCNTPQ
jgi:hypothetical protein